MSIKHIIKIKKSTPAKEDDLDEDRIRYEEHDEKEYTEQFQKKYQIQSSQTKNNFISVQPNVTYICLT